MHLELRTALSKLLGQPVADEHFALAVSGGADSLALLLLAVEARLNVTVLSVDHGLRAEARAETEMVAAICGNLGVPQYSLRVNVDSAAASVQASARNARYEAMAAWCESAGVCWLLTAHHADDQAETLIMRLSRGSGVSGMTGIRARRPINGYAVEVLRPLLGVRKADLIAIVAEKGLTPVNDPSNHDPAYDRTSARALLADGKIDALRAAESAMHLAGADEALEWTLGLAWESRAEITDGSIEIDVRGLPQELVRRLVLRVIKRLNPSATPDGPSVSRLIEALSADLTGNLAGATVEPGKRWRFSSSAPRSGPVQRKSRE